MARARGLRAPGHWTSSVATTLSELILQNTGSARRTGAHCEAFVFVLAMASGAGKDPAFGFSGTQPMAATPQNRRPRPQREEGVGIRDSPNAKRTVKLTDPVQAEAAQPNMNQEQLTAGYHLVHAQALDNLAHIAEMKDAIDDHAARLDRLKPLWPMLTRLEETSRQTSADLTEVAKQVVDNDSELKAKLKELEKIVDGHGSAIPQLRTDVQSAVAEVMSQASGQAAASNIGVGPAPSTVTLEMMEARIASVTEGVSHSLKALEAVLADAQVSMMPTRLREIAEGMRSMDSRIRQLETTATAAPAPAAPAPPTAPESWGSMQWSQAAQTSVPTQPQQQQLPQQPVTGPGVAQPPPFVHPYQHAAAPQQQQRQQQQQQQHMPGAQISGPQYFGISSDKKPVFDEKTATSDAMRYPEANQELWMKTTRNYLIGKANEMEQFLEWAESWKSHPISKAAVASLSHSNVCMDNEPMKLSKDLWSYLNLALANAKDRSGLDNADPGNGFDAWRRIVVPLGPRSAERLETMHDSITSPPKSRKLADLEKDLDNWDTKLGEYYRCGGEVFTDPFKIRTARKFLPPTVPHTVTLELKKIIERGGSYYEWRETLRSSIAYLMDTGNLQGGGHAANVVADGAHAVPGSLGPTLSEVDAYQDEGDEQPAEMPTADDFPGMHSLSLVSNGAVLGRHPRKSLAPPPSVRMEVPHPATHEMSSVRTATSRATPHRSAHGPKWNSVSGSATSAARLDTSRGSARRVSRRRPMLCSRSPRRLAGYS